MTPRRFYAWQDRHPRAAALMGACIPGALLTWFLIEGAAWLIGGAS